MGKSLLGTFLFVILVLANFGFEGIVFVFIVPVPCQCLYLTFQMYRNFNWKRYASCKHVHVMHTPLHPTFI